MLKSTSSPSQGSKEIQRPSILLTLQMQDRFGLPLDPSSAWFILQEAFKNHPHITITKAEFRPDKEEATSIHGNV